MARYSENHDRVKRVVITPEITRAYWSRPRAFQGEKVTLFVETARAPDDLELTIQIWEDGADTGDPDGFVAELEGVDAYAIDTEFPANARISRSWR